MSKRFLYAGLGILALALSNCGEKASKLDYLIENHIQELKLNNKFYNNKNAVGLAMKDEEIKNKWTDKNKAIITNKLLQNCQSTDIIKASNFIECRLKAYESGIKDLNREALEKSLDTCLNEVSKNPPSDKCWDTWYLVS